jgi:uncharacterized protein YbjT (DUF2867 family)
MEGVILITGASGRVGRRAAELLAQDSQRLRLMTRDPERAPKLPGADIVRGDFAEPATLDQAFAGIRTALVISGSGKPGERALLHRNAFQAATRAGVGYLVYLSLEGAAPDSRYPYSRDHYLSEQFLADAGRPFTVLRNAFYLDMFLEKFDSHGIVCGPAKQGFGAFISREDAARTAAAAVRNPVAGIYDVTGPEALSVAEVAQQLSALTGRELRYQEGDAGPDELSSGWYEAIAAGELARVTDSVRQFTGKPPLRLEEYFKQFPRLLEKLSLTPAANTTES